MKPSNETKPETAPSSAEISTGAAMEANTSQPGAEALQAFTLASAKRLEAVAARYRSEEAEHRAMAEAHRADPFLPAGDRLALIAIAEQRAENAAEAAENNDRRAADLRKDIPAAAALAEPPMAVIVITVQRDRIQQTARLMMGGARAVSRTWDRTGRGSWRSRDLEWSAHENRVGVELVEYMDALSLPDRVAEMLPRPSHRVAPKLPEVANG